MGQLGDALIIVPLSASSNVDPYGLYPTFSGSSKPAEGPAQVYLRTVQQTHSATMYVVMSPSGGMTGSLLLAPANPNRAKLTILNSGSRALALEHGNQDFNPNNPASPTNTWDNLIIGTVTLQGNQGVVPSEVYEDRAPVYTGPIRCAWVGSGTLSASAAILTDYSL